jgi:hypothetical protein
VAGGVGYAWFEVELVSYDVPYTSEPAGDVLLLPDVKLDVVMPLPDTHLIVAIAPSVNLGVVAGSSSNPSVRALEPDDALEVEVDDSANLQVLGA